MFIRRLFLFFISLFLSLAILSESQNTLFIPNIITSEQPKTSTEFEDSTTQKTSIHTSKINKRNLANTISHTLFSYRDKKLPSGNIFVYHFPLIKNYAFLV